MQIHDVTRLLSEKAVVYTGDLVPSFSQVDQGMYLISDLRMSSHSGTHIDAPAHYLKTGDTIDTVPLTNLIGKCRVLDVSDAGSRITAASLDGRIDCTERLLLKTAFSGKDKFEENYPSLTMDAARLITARRIRCVGIDSPSIEAFQCDGTVHRELLGHGCIIIELLDLSGVTEGDYEMVALPLRLAGLDGSPARVVLINRMEE
ncbi:MAG: cyclase family protein [Methanoregula sp.]|nr:cyclase family protein [Methanoregula sp.]